MLKPFFIFYKAHALAVPPASIFSRLSGLSSKKIVKVTGDVQIRKYLKGRLLGKGGFAKCYEFINNETKREDI